MPPTDKFSIYAPTFYGDITDWLKWTRGGSPLSFLQYEEGTPQSLGLLYQRG